MDRDAFNSTVSWGAILAGGFTAAAVSLIVVAFGVGAGPIRRLSVGGRGDFGHDRELERRLVPRRCRDDRGDVRRLHHRSAAPRLGRCERPRTFFPRYRPWLRGLGICHGSDRDRARGRRHPSACRGFGGCNSGGGTQARPQAASNSGDIYVDRLLRAGTADRWPQRAAPASDQAATRAELLRVIAPATRKGGDVSPDDRAYAARVIAARTGLPQAEAEQRVNQTISQAKEATDRPAGRPPSFRSGLPFLCSPGRSPEALPPPKAANCAMRVGTKKTRQPKPQL